MKMLNRIFCLFLAMVLLLGMIPMFAAAETKTDEKDDTKKSCTVTITVMNGTKKLYTYTVKVSDKKVKLKDKEYITYKKKTYQYSVYKVNGKETHKVTIPAYDGTTAWEKKWKNTIKVYYTPHSHKYIPGYNRIYHWSICECGETTNEIRHVDPATDSDKICTCGYEFNDNADLTTLWLANMQLSPAFKKEITEYTGVLHTYRDVTSTSISTRTFDALAKVTLPEDLEIREGPNKFEILVTAEDKTATKTYTVLVVKPIKVEDTLIGNDGETLSVTLKTTVKQKVASAALTEAVEQKLLELTADDAVTCITLLPQFSKWSVKQTELMLSADLLKAIANQGKANLAVETPYETVLTIPAAEIAGLAEGRDTVTIRITKDNTFALLSGEEEIPAPEAVTLVLPEKADKT